MAKLLKFGTIAETEDGDLVFRDFRVDGNGENDVLEPGDAIMSLCIQRLLKEREKWRNSQLNRNWEKYTWVGKP